MKKCNYCHIWSHSGPLKDYIKDPKLFLTMYQFVSKSISILPPCNQQEVNDLKRVCHVSEAADTNLSAGCEVIEKHNTHQEMHGIGQMTGFQVTNSVESFECNFILLYKPLFMQTLRAGQEWEDTSRQRNQVTLHTVIQSFLLVF